MFKLFLSIVAVSLRITLTGEYNL